MPARRMAKRPLAENSVLFSITGQVLQDAVSFCDDSTSSCWAEEGRRQCLVGRYHDILL